VGNFHGVEIESYRQYQCDQEIPFQIRSGIAAWFNQGMDRVAGVDAARGRPTVRAPCKLTNRTRTNNLYGHREGEN
jgi:hypothetical protein